MSSSSSSLERQAWGKGWPAIADMQRRLAASHAFIHRKMPGDGLTSRVIPLGLTAVGATLCVQGLYHMILGIGRTE